MNDSLTRYGAVSRLLHWSIALLLLAQLAGAGARELLGKHNVVSGTLGPWHSDIGLALLVLIFMRLIWTSAQITQRPINEGPWRHVAALVHGLLYALMLLVPLAGVMMKAGAGKAIAFMGVTLVPAGTGNSLAKNLWHETHGFLAWALAALIAVHIAAALYHAIMRDGVVGRMLSLRSE